MRVYVDLFLCCWGFEVMGKVYLVEVFGLLCDFMIGLLIYLNDEFVVI